VTVTDDNGFYYYDIVSCGGLVVCLTGYTLVVTNMCDECPWTCCEKTHQYVISHSNLAGHSFVVATMLTSES